MCIYLFSLPLEGGLIFPFQDLKNEDNGGCFGYAEYLKLGLGTNQLEVRVESAGPDLPSSGDPDGPRYIEFGYEYFI